MDDEELDRQCDSTTNAGEMQPWSLQITGNFKDGVISNSCQHT